MCTGFEMVGSEETPTLGKVGLGEVCRALVLTHKALRQDAVDLPGTLEEGVEKTSPIHGRIWQPSSLSGSW